MNYLLYVMRACSTELYAQARGKGYDGGWYAGLFVVVSTLTGLVGFVTGLILSLFFPLEDAWIIALALLGSGAGAVGVILWVQHLPAAPGADRFPPSSLAYDGSPAALPPGAALETFTYCPQCASLPRAGDIFCRHCGERLREIQLVG
jgi:hypothetical protein